MSGAELKTSPVTGSTAKPVAPARPAADSLPFDPALGAFLRRTLLAGLITLGLVALTAAVYWSPGWAGIYCLAGLWATAFFALTPLSVKALLFDRRRAAGLVFIAAKLMLLFGMFVFCWRLAGARSHPDHAGGALMAGVVTPLAVAVLRVLGRAFRAPSPKLVAAPPGETLRDDPARVESKS